MSGFQSQKDRRDAQNKDDLNLWTRINRGIWGWYKPRHGSVTVPATVLDEFPEDVEWGWRVLRNRDEARVALENGLFDSPKILGEARSPITH